MLRILALLALAMWLSGCARMGSQMASEEYQSRPAVETSLFSSDAEVLSEEAVQRILSSKIELPPKAKIAIMKLPSRREMARMSYYYGRAYMRTEEYISSQSLYYEALHQSLSASDRVSELILMPSLMVPNDATVSVLREAAVRMQADLLVVYRAEASAYEKYLILAKDKVKAHGTAEALLLDVRTGVIPFAYTASETFEGRKEKQDLNNDEMMRRAEDQAIVGALRQLGDKLREFLGSIP